MAKNYRLYALVFMCSNDSIQSVNNSYYVENMSCAQALFEADLKNKGMVALSIISEAQVRKKIQSRK